MKEVTAYEDNGKVFLTRYEVGYARALADFHSIHIPLMRDLSYIAIIEAAFNEFLELLEEHGCIKKLEGPAE